GFDSSSSSYTKFYQFHIHLLKVLIDSIIHGLHLLSASLFQGGGDLSIKDSCEDQRIIGTSQL
ncbi:unnamed protein product, partial [Brassica oleracea var. botrytis]